MGSFGDNDKKIESIENNSDADLSDFDDTQPVDDEFSLLSGKFFLFRFFLPLNLLHFFVHLLFV